MASSPLAPVSVLRKSGSSTCLQPRDAAGELPHSLSSTNLFTIVHSEELPHYSAERYYILSELQLKAHSISFLSEWDAGIGYHQNHQPATDDSHTTQEMSYSSLDQSIRDGDCDGKENDNSSNSNNSVRISNVNVGEENIQEEAQQRRNRHDSNLNLPPYVVLYLLWRHDSPHAESPEDFAKHYIRPCVQRVLDAYECIESSSTTTDSSTGEAPSQPSSSSSIIGEHDSGDGGGEDAKISMQDKNQYSGVAKPEEKSAPHIYLVIDRICSKPPPLPTESYMTQSYMTPDSSPEDELQWNEDYNDCQIALTKELIQIVATSQALNLRSVIEGITAGISTDVKAAPGLERCMDAIMVGDAERRLMLERNRKGIGGATTEAKLFTGGKWTMDDPQCSCIGIIADHHDDLVGLDPTMEADAVQGMALHSRMYAEWSGRGIILNFATRSQKLWRSCLVKGRGGTMASGTLNETDEVFMGKRSIMSRRRRKRQQRRKSKSLCSGDMKKHSEDVSNILVALFLAFMYAHIWNHYGEELKDAASFTYKLAQGTREVLGI